MELLKDYDVHILYHPRKANVIVDALSRKPMGSLAHISSWRRSLVEQLHSLEWSGACLEISDSRGFLAHIELRSTLMEEIKATQVKDSSLAKIIKDVEESKVFDFSINPFGVLRFRTRLCVPEMDKLRSRNLREFHHSRFAIHPGTTKMYQDLKQLFWWSHLKEDVARTCLTCQIYQQLKAEHKRPGGLLESITIPKWK
ncbi:uncharacterized protein LOC127787551 [Diospyros lotus]|uniref:uncharacterized protein LOC127787551 n=1 Tax=Diospyros lotus TaxID=55363 RepID=UPI00224FC4BC|nr:uncharacterized protein LOC127787551 [Diospyros lotus]